MFKDAADRLLQVGEPRTHVVTGFDTELKQIVKGTVLHKITGGREALGDFSKVSYSITCADTSLTLAADVLANSVHHHLKNRQEQSVGEPLNKIESIQGHVLAELVCGVHGSNQGTYFAAAVYMHPEIRGKRDENDT